MNDYIPTKVRDLTESKQRVMRNVVNEIENNTKRSKHKWQYVVITAVLTMSAMLFVLNEIMIENELPATEVQSPTEKFDLTKPSFTEKQGAFYLHGITLGDSQEKVMERLDGKFSIMLGDGSEEDMIMDLGEQVKFYFMEDTLTSIEFTNVDESYFEKLFNDYDGFKFFLSMPTAFDGRVIYSKKTNMVLEESTTASKENISLSLYYADSNLQENAEYLYMTEQTITNNQPPHKDLNTDVSKPAISVVEDRLYFHGVTLGDSPAKVIEQLGYNYLIGKVDSGVETDFVLDYDGKASFIFFQNKLDLIVLREVDKNYFDQLYKDYDGFKFISSPYEVDSDRYFYLKETGHALRATTNTPDKDLYVSLSYPDPNFWEHPEMKDLD